MISAISLRMLKSWAAKNRRKLGQLLGTERTDRLLDQVVEQLLYKGRVRFSARRQIRRQVPNPAKFHLFTRAGLIGSGCVDRLTLLLVSISTEGVEMLQGKSERIDHTVARPARFRLSLNRHPLPGRQVRMKIGGERGNGFGRRPEHSAQDAAGNENPAMDR